ncbi:polyribonucleotide nucleotidyltransferase [Syntrophotalea carbinolica DSM 2380]|uniref:Polyribonucleotide nucleotidyltransferase n=1 Tax=Syntrophotalea carbinolica (strain DSM 2380 / NBRC 103641 / GraBd1) TaxID=338963 RepID=PNP_SYNC1|nr:polyribonucleotide nucleotidyltransferase [Syntrophotalea carbinolica]Q3A4A1.1 RecName: Full=Polyribonucleotide nucleotidyltransferase; AltName: Full=Polynucleotide phosphorylase; Short=PNPase [Syntrophotalea carbinolica DSM 2380]ABA88806.1 polyribonucleotide nucleotidyltransferase [Syntrophotalea carbinolica DSM 2380]
MAYQKVECQFNGQTLTLETGKMARQADGAVVVSFGGTKVLCTAVSAKQMREGQSFFPLTVNYQEKFYAGGKIPGSFFRRERGATERETLVCRLIDRPLRPLFPKGYMFETQIMPTVISVDEQNDPDTLAMVGASAAIAVSDIPFDGPVAAVRVGRVEGNLIANPTIEQRAESDMDIIVSGSRDAIIMVEGETRFISEQEMLDALFFAHEAIQPLIDVQLELVKIAGKEKREFSVPEIDPAVVEKVAELAETRLSEAVKIRTKQDRYAAVAEIKTEILETLAADFEDQEDDISEAFGNLQKRLVRQMVARDKVRIDGRDKNTIRPITCEIGLLPRAHGSALFTRGETQALVAAALGTSKDEQRMDNVQSMEFKKFMLHYNFPPFCVGETSMRLFPGRREIGHGMLAERSIAQVLPNHDDFPYTLRVVSDILESNGSSSMASVCGASLALMDAGVPVSEAVAGIAMGLIKEGDDIVVLSDILGDEDHLGDMDFKVTGTREGITALQMDIKIKGVSKEIMQQALEQAREGRLHILDKMAEAITAPRSDLSPYAPRITTIQVKPDQVRTVIGPGGKNVRGIIEATGCAIDIEDDGRINIASADGDACKAAIKMIRNLTQEAVVGKLYMATVKKIMEFGAFVEIFPGTEGLVHISELAKERVKKVTDILQEGDQVLVKCLDIDRQGKIKLSRKEALGQSLPEEG